jgi:tetratricopeptide (TPR) repeat protein
MEHTSKPPPPSTPPQITRGRLIRLGVLIVVAAALVVLWSRLQPPPPNVDSNSPFLERLRFVLRYRRKPPPPPSMPDVPLDEMEPQVAKAIQTGMERVRKEPNSPDSWGFLGKLFLAHACEKQAEECFARAAQLDDQQPRWPYFRYYTLQGRDREAAQPYLERAVELFDKYEPEMTAPRLALVESLLDRGRVDQADEQLRIVETREPNNPRVLFNRGVIANRRDDWKRAVECFTRVENLPSCRKKARSQLALLYQILNEPARAAEYDQLARIPEEDESWLDPLLEESFSLSRDSQKMMRDASNLEKQGRFQDALILLQEAARASKRITIEAAVATNLAQQERFEEATDLLRKLIARDPKLLQLHYNLGTALYYWGEDFRAKKPNEPELALAKYREGVPALRRAIAAKPDHALAHTFLGLSLWRLGKQNEGLAKLRVGVRLQPTNMLTHYHLARMLEEQGQYAEALEEYQKASRFAERGDPRPGRGIERVQERMKKKG